MSGGEVLLRCEGAAFGYGAVVSHVTFTLSAGETLCVLGENGSGKSTLVKGVLGLIPPIAGRVTLCGALRRDALGYLPQSTAVPRDFPADVFEVVLSGRQSAKTLGPFYSRADREAAAHALDEVGLSALAHRPLRALSGGQRQRVFLARALAAAHRVLLLDEPEAGLDPPSAAALYETVRRLCAQRGLAVLLISHNPAAVQRADTVLHLRTNGAHIYAPAADYQKTALYRSFTGGDAE